MLIRNFVAVAFCFSACALNAFARAGAPHTNRDPYKVKFVTSDIVNFWRAFDLAAKENERAKKLAIFQTEYLDKGSAGLRDMGYKISKAYYQNSRDKRQAISDVLNIKDFQEFFRRSRYGEKFEGHGANARP